MTDTVAILPPTAPPLPPGGLARPGLRPLEGSAAADSTSGGNARGTPEAGAEAGFTAVLQGFLGATLAPAPVATVTAPDPVDAGLATASDSQAPAAATPIPGTGTSPEPAPTAPVVGDATGNPLLASGNAGGKPLPPATAGAAADGPGGEPVPAAATGADATPGDTPPPGADLAIRSAARRGAVDAAATAATDSADGPDGTDAAAWLADIARSRSALAGSPRKPAGDRTAGDAALPTGPVATVAEAAPTTATLRDAALLATIVTGQPGFDTSATAAGAATATAGPTARGEPMTDPSAGRSLAPLADGASFASGLGERLLDLGRDGVQSARLRLHPESLGPLDVRIRIDAGEAQVWFNTSQGQTRDAIEASLPRLRELFAAQGLELGRVQVDVRSDGGGSAPWQGFADDTGRDRGRRANGEPGDSPADRRRDTALGRLAAALRPAGGAARLVDVFA